MRLTLDTYTASDHALYRQAFDTEPDCIAVSESLASTFNIGGDTVVGFVAVLVSGMVTNAAYDGAKLYFTNLLTRIRERRRLAESPALSITLNGRVYAIRSDADLDTVLDAIIAALDDERTS